MQQGTDRGCKHAQIRGMNLKKKKKKGILLKLCLVLYSEIGLKKLFSLIKRKITTFFFLFV